MNPTLKRIIAVIGGASVAVCLISLSEMISAHIYPPPADIELLIKDPETTKEMMASIPVNAYLLVLAGWLIGCFAGGLVASLFSGRENVRASFTVGVIIIAGGIMNTVALPGQPIWFLVISFVSFIPFAVLGHLAVRKKAVKI